MSDKIKAAKTIEPCEWYGEIGHKFDGSYKVGFCMCGRPQSVLDDEEPVIHVEFDDEERELLEDASKLSHPDDEPEATPTVPVVQTKPKASAGERPKAIHDLSGFVGNGKGHYYHRSEADTLFDAKDARIAELEFASRVNHDEHEQVMHAIGIPECPLHGGYCAPHVASWMKETKEENVTLRAKMKEMEERR